MGDRSNVVFKNGDDGIGVYAHWGGIVMAEVVADVISRDAFKKRIGDPSYATRIGVQAVLEMLGADSNSDTGFGLWTMSGRADDNEYPYIVVDVMDGAVYVTPDYRSVEGHRVDPPTQEAIEEAMQSG